MQPKDYFPHYVQAMDTPLPEMQQYFAREQEYLLALVKPTSTVLDVGCGTGRNCRDLAPHVAQVVGIDSDAQMIAAAQTALVGMTNVTLDEEDFFTYDIPEQFDLTITTYNTLGGPLIHAFKRQAFLKKMIECTKPGGHVVATFWRADAMAFSTQYFASVGIEVMALEEGRVVTNAGVFKRFTKPEIVELMEGLSEHYEIIPLTAIFYLLDITV